MWSHLKVLWWFPLVSVKTQRICESIRNLFKSRVYGKSFVSVHQVASCGENKSLILFFIHNNHHQRDILISTKCNISSFSEEGARDTRCHYLQLLCHHVHTLFSSFHSGEFLWNVNNLNFDTILKGRSANGAILQLMSQAYKRDDSMNF